MKTTEKRNVLLLIGDDWSPIAGCYGNDAVHTPHIDGLARGSTVFEQAFCTTPSCAASRANLLTGLYGHQHGQYGHCHGIHGFRTHDWVRSVPKVLGEHGVRTGLVGKVHIAPPEVYPFAFVRSSNGWSNEALAAEAGTFLETTPREQPFFLQVASLYPHRDVDGGFPPETEAEEFQSADRAYAADSVAVPDFLPDTAEARRDWADYYRYVTRFDDFVGKLLRVLEDSGRADETLVVLMSDHGMPFPGAKASPFEGGHHCPLIVRDPGRPETAGRCDALVNWSDLAPTIYDWFEAGEGVRPPNLPGRSLLPILGEASPPGWDRTFYAHNFHEVTNYFPYRVVRERRYKFVRALAHEQSMPMPMDLFRSPVWREVRERRPERLGARSLAGTLRHDREALYDLEADPAETRNLIGDPAVAETADRMRRELIEFCRNTNDPWLEVLHQEGDLPDPGAS